MQRLSQNVGNVRRMNGKWCVCVANIKRIVNDNVNTNINVKFNVKLTVEMFVRATV